MDLEEEIAYVFSPEVSFHVQVIYLADTLHFWNMRKLVSCNKGLIEWCRRNYMHFMQLPTTEEGRWIRAAEKKGEEAEEKWRAAHPETYVHRCGRMTTHPPHTWGNPRKYNCPGITELDTSSSS